MIFGSSQLLLTTLKQNKNLLQLILETMEWISTQTTGRQPEPRSFHTCTVVGNRVVVFGGRSLENAHFDDVHIFDTGD